MPPRPRTVLVERLQSPAQQQSQEKYLVPRNCWLRITSIQLRPERLERNAKVRIRISVPNSARVVRTSWISVDSQLLSALQASQNAAGFSDLSIDITILCEYRHDIRFNHPSNLDFDIETSRGKTIASATVDLAKVIQCPIETILLCRKDNIAAASLKIEAHSLCISRMAPASAPEVATVEVLLSESDSELVLPMARQVEQKITDALATGHILLLNTKTPQGAMLQQASFSQDYIVAVTEPSVIQFVFDCASRQLPADPQSPFRFVIAGDTNFLAAIMREFIVVREKGMFVTDSFAFIFLPLVPQTVRETKEFAGAVPVFSGRLCAPEWLSIFDGESTTQNLSSIVDQKLAYVMSAPLATVELQIADVLLTTVSAQFVVPMFFNLSIGDYSRGAGQKEMKGTFFGESTKTRTMKFHHLLLSVVKSRIIVVWRVMSNVTPLSPATEIEKSTSERTCREGAKVLLSLKKGQSLISIWIDGTEHKDVVGIAVTIRDPRMALHLCVAANETAEAPREA
jgi:hypothetical protein